MNYAAPRPFNLYFNLSFWNHRVNELTPPANVSSPTDSDIPSVRSRVAPKQLRDCFKTASAFGGYLLAKRGSKTQH